MAKPTGNPNGRPPKFKTVEEMNIAVNEYFEECRKEKRPLTMTGLAIALGFESRQSLVDYKQRDEGFSDTIKKARNFVERDIEERMMSSSGVVAGHIFNLKNNFGWRDRQDIENTLKGDIEVKWKGE